MGNEVRKGLCDVQLAGLKLVEERECARIDRASRGSKVDNVACIVRREIYWWCFEMLDSRLFPLTRRQRVRKKILDR